MSRAVARHPVVAFTIITFAFSWAMWGAGSLLPPAAAVLDPIATFGPAVAAVVMTASLAAPGGRWRAVGSLLLRLVRPRAAVGWYLLALLLFPAISLVGIGILGLTGNPVDVPGFAGSPGAIVLQLASVFLLTALLGGPLGEEIGWRGFMLPNLQTRWSPLLSSLFIGLAWGAWHLPLHLRGLYDGTMGDGIAGFGLRLLSSTSLAILFTWLYNRGRGDLLLMVILHTSVNNTSGFWLPVHAGVQLVLIPVLIVLVLVDRMYRGPGTKDPTRRADDAVGSNHDPSTAHEPAVDDRDRDLVAPAQPELRAARGDRRQPARDLPRQLPGG